MSLLARPITIGAGFCITLATLVNVCFFVWSKAPSNVLIVHPVEEDKKWTNFDVFRETINGNHVLQASLAYLLYIYYYYYCYYYHYCYLQLTPTLR